ncbi:MAG TPA: NAD(P)-dependent oxidoreductase, partial [Chitinophagales bacterium]
MTYDLQLTTKKVLITDDVHPALINGLRELNYEVDFLPEITFLDVKNVIADYEGLVINSKIFCGEELLNEAVKLRWIGRLGSGMEVIDTKICEQKGIAYFNSPEGNRNAVAEHALGLLLALMRNIVKANNEVKQNLWIREPNRGEELSGKTVAIIGFGNTGESFAKVLRGFDVKILAYDKYKSNFEFEATMAQIFQEADIVSLHLPLTDETK